MRHGIVAILVGALCGACNSVPTNKGEPATVGQVVAQIKTELDAYQKYDAATANDRPREDACHGLIRLAITGVDISLVTQTTDKSGSSASAVLPVGSASFGPSFANSSETVGTQTLEFTVYPKPYPEPDKNQVPSDWRKIPQNAPLAASLAQLREGLLDASEHDPCVTLVPDGDDAAKAAGGTSEFGFAVTNTKTAGATLQLVIFSLGTTRDRERHFGNTIKVHFKALKGDALYFTNKTLFLTK